LPLAGEQHPRSGAHFSWRPSLVDNPGVGLAEELVAAIDGVSGGPHHGFRAAHAKGVVCEGSFVATPEASALTTAAHMQGEPVRATVRFSNGSGNPNAHDGARDSRGIAVKLYLPDGSRTDIIGVTSPSFFARTPEDFLEFTRARKPDPHTGQPDAARVGAYLEAHPEAQPAVRFALGAAPAASYARCVYNSLHAYAFVGPTGQPRFVRYRWRPEAGEAALDDDVARSKPPDYLAQEMVERLSQGPVRFAVELKLAAEEDDPNDPCVAWPEERETVVAGHLEITGLDASRERDGDVLVFDPTRVTAGIELSDDPILAVRSGVYSASVARRTV
jgi:catalase